LANPAPTPPSTTNQLYNTKQPQSHHNNQSFPPRNLFHHSPSASISNDSGNLHQAYTLSQINSQNPQQPHKHHIASDDLSYNLALSSISNDSGNLHEAYPLSQINYQNPFTLSSISKDLENPEPIPPYPTNQSPNPESFHDELDLAFLDSSTFTNLGETNLPDTANQIAYQHLGVVDEVLNQPQNNTDSKSNPLVKVILLFLLVFAYRQLISTLLFQIIDGKPKIDCPRCTHAFHPSFIYEHLKKQHKIILYDHRRDDDEKLPKDLLTFQKSVKKWRSEYECSRRKKHTSLKSISKESKPISIEHPTPVRLSSNNSLNSFSCFPSQTDIDSCPLVSPSVTPFQSLNALLTSLLKPEDAKHFLTNITQVISNSPSSSSAPQIGGNLSDASALSSNLESPASLSEPISLAEHFALSDNQCPEDDNTEDAEETQEPPKVLKRNTLTFLKPQVSPDNHTLQSFTQFQTSLAGGSLTNKLALQNTVMLAKFLKFQRNGNSDDAILKDMDSKTYGLCDSTKIDSFFKVDLRISLFFLHF
jgi:hypothetical protein